MMMMMMMLLGKTEDGRGTTDAMPRECQKEAGHFSTVSAA